ncbi:SapC family protein [Thalassotalea eurytherma]|uniref:Peptidase n=1 Tax=Thalassotalea eurytherma TaxID=1144278 RepID=A0ABQ6GYZ4_9GAMM|nr:SapC family protein [Thalassotalea eurytherma]GLX81120.1 peptidase [Thalassotalea eurytherma]
MANHVLVNNVDHKDIKINNQRHAKFGDNIWYTQTFPLEFRSVQAYYPIFFIKNPQTAKFLPVSLFGFKNDENLFLSEQGWDAGYIPLMIQRQPFMIGRQTVTEDGQEKEHRVLTLDIDHPRVNKEEGHALFLEFGGNSEFLDRAADMMETIHHGVEDSEIFVNMLTEFELLEPFTLDITLNDNSKNEMVGFYTINEEKFKQLDDDIVVKLHNQGYLHAIYMTLASHGNIRELINRKNAQLGL